MVHPAGYDAASVSVLPASSNLENGQILPLRPFRIVSLLEVIEFWGNHFHDATVRLHYYAESELYSTIGRRGGQAPLTEEDKTRAREFLDRIKHACEPFGMTLTMRRYYSAYQITFSHLITLEKLQWEMQEVEKALRSDLQRIGLMYMPDDKLQYLSEWRKNRKIAGVFDSDDVPPKKQVSYRLPEANKEISVAGDCFAIEAYTACVFHLMRAVEIGARVMISKSGLNAEKYLQRPIEMCEWEELIHALNKSLDDLRPGTRSDPKKKDKLEHYTQLVGIFMHFRGPWRNKVSHVRHVYRPGETKDAMDNTRQFLVLLAQRAREGKKIR
jgi:hypothetical protein